MSAVIKSDGTTEWYKNGKNIMMIEMKWIITACCNKK